MAGFDTWVRPGNDFAMRSAVIGELPRTQRLDALEAWYNGCAYSVGINAKPYAWDQEFTNDGKRVKLEDRRPKQYNLAKKVVNTSAGWLFGFEHFPSIEAEGDEATEEWISVLSEAIQLPRVMLKAAKSGGKSGTAVLVFKVVKGYPRIEHLPAKHCIRRVGPDGESLEWLRYQYKAPASYFEELGYEGLDSNKDYWYRREYDPSGEYHYHLAPVSQDGTPPVFEEDTEKTVRHNLGVLAAVWIRNLDGDDEIDGDATYAGVEDLLDEANKLVSLATRSIRKQSDPTLAYTGVEDVEDLPEQQKVGSSSGGSVVSPGDAKLLEMEGSGQAAALTWVDRLREAIQEITRSESPSADDISGGKMSGYALRILFSALISLVGELRMTYGPGLVRLVRLMLRLVAAVQANGQAIILPRPVKGKLNPEAVLALKWGDYFPPTPEDTKVEIENAGAATALQLISLETAQAKIGYLYGVEDLAAEANRIKRERGADPEHDGAEEAMQALERGEKDGDDRDN